MNDLVKRYIYATVSYLPSKLQTEVEHELEGMIEELLEARYGEAQPNDAQVRVVLTELGRPWQLAMQFSGDEDRALLSGVYYLWFKRFALIVVPILAVLGAIAAFIDTGFDLQLGQQELVQSVIHVFTMAATVVAGAFGGAAQGLMWLMLVFAIMERRQVSLADEDWLSKLPAVPDFKAQIKLHEPIIGAIVTIIGTAVMISFPYIIVFYYQPLGWVPVFNTAFIRAHWYLLVAWAALGVIDEAVKLIERHYNWRVAASTTLTNLLSGAFAAFMLGSSELLNPDLPLALKAMLGTDVAPELTLAASNANMILLAIVIFGLAIDTIVTCYRAYRYSG